MRKDKEMRALLKKQQEEAANAAKAASKTPSISNEFLKNILSSNPANFDNLLNPHSAMNQAQP